MEVALNSRSCSSLLPRDSTAPAGPSRTLVASTLSPILGLTFLSLTFHFPWLVLLTAGHCLRPEGPASKHPATRCNILLLQPHSSYSECHTLIVSHATRSRPAAYITCPNINAILDIVLNERWKRCRQSILSRSKRPLTTNLTSVLYMHAKTA